MIEGRLTRDAVTRFTQSGKAVAGFAIASDVGFGENKKTLFVDCSLWGNRAEGGLIQYLTKGTYVVVHGELQPTEYTNKDGMQIKDKQLNVSDVKLGGAKSDNASQQQNNGSLPSHGGNQQPSARSQQNGQPNNDPFANAPDFGDVPVDDDITF